MIKLLWLVSAILFAFLFYKEHKKESLKLFSPLVFSFGLMVGLCAFILYQDLLEMALAHCVGLSIGWSCAAGYFFHTIYCAIKSKAE